MYMFVAVYSSVLFREQLKSPVKFEMPHECQGY